MKKCIISIAILLSCIVLNAQSEIAEFYNFQDSIDKLNLEIAATNDLLSKVEKLTESAFYYSDPNQQIAVLKEANSIATPLEADLLKTEIGLELAVVYNVMGEYGKSIRLYDSLVPIYKTLVDETEFNRLEFQHAKSLVNAGRYYEALEVGIKAYNYFSSQNDQETYSGLMSQVIASVYTKLGRKRESIQQYNTSIKWCNQDDNPSCVSFAYQQISNLHLDLEEIDLANESLIKAENAIKNHPELQWNSTFINLIKAKIKIAEKNGPGAIQILDANFKDVLDDKDESQIAKYHLIYAKAYIINQQYQKALRHSSTSLDIGNKRQSVSIKKSAHYTNSIIFEKLGNPSKALEAYRNYTAINESILSSEKITQINELDTKYKNAIIEGKLINLEKENAINALKLEKGNQRKLILVGSAAFLLLLLILVLYYLKRKSKINSILADKNEIISKSLQDKDILLREIHHRVKNNLQVVSSLLNLQSNYISDDIALEAITEGKNRVSSMALIHQNLYQEENLTSIRSKDYFDDLIENLFESYNIEEGNIHLIKEIEDLDIDVDTMIPLGLIVNELVSNSLKHAFKGIDHKGKITVKLKEENNTLTLSISDNGVGMSEDHFLSSDSFGNKMIKAFKQKLNAEISVENNEGTKVSIHIKNYKLIAA